jgi:hypothetical protein
MSSRYMLQALPTIFSAQERFGMSTTHEARGFDELSLRGTLFLLHPDT